MEKNNEGLHDICKKCGFYETCEAEGCFIIDHINSLEQKVEWLKSELESYKLQNNMLQSLVRATSSDLTEKQEK